MILDESINADKIIVYTDTETLQHTGELPLLDRHPTLGWILKNKNETLAVGLKWKKK
ncbi:hypothetical protein ACE1TI_10240 [Alteribacillus sp. JSM 102045]|uniref:hypothetical protein n=1 Tax=Alteribacillus sp. JSM 102045 TaxID=1562101 RepID=UPI0035C1FFDF